jgi:large subunit ribosomal protein L25
MSTNIVLNVDVREKIGKSGARAARRAGLVPGVIYGGDLGPVAINLRSNEVRKALNTGNFISTMMELDHDGKRQQVMARDIQFHPVSDAAMHVDLYRVDENTKINVGVSVRFTNESESPGMVRGGVLNIVRHEIEITCPAGNIPEFLEADLTGLDIGDSIHISAITLPEGAISTIKDRDFTIVTLQGSRAVLTETEDEDAVEVEEGEETEADAEEGGEE